MAGEGTWCVCWHVMDHAESMTTSDSRKAYDKYNQLRSEGQWATRLHDPTGRCLKWYGSMSKPNWQMLEDEREKIQDKVQADRGMPWVIKWHEIDHCESAEYWDEREARDAYDAVSRQWAKRLYAPGQKYDDTPVEQYGSMSRDDWAMLMPCEKTMGVVKEGSGYCVVSFPGVLPLLWNKIMKKACNFACVWTGIMGSKKNEWFPPWQRNVEKAYKMGNELIAVKKPDGSFGIAQTEEIDWITNVAKMPLTKMSHSEFESRKLGS